MGIQIKRGTGEHDARAKLKWVVRAELFVG
jgi:hypothetical protein